MVLFECGGVRDVEFVSGCAQAVVAGLNTYAVIAIASW